MDLNAYKEENLNDLTPGTEMFTFANEIRIPKQNFYHGEFLFIEYLYVKNTHPNVVL